MRGNWHYYLLFILYFIMRRMYVILLRKIVSDDFYLRTPLSLIISSARGTRKTMMFKYFSFQVQAIMAGKNNESVLDCFKKNKSVSMYLKFDLYMLQAFSDDEIGRLVFTYFFELVVCEAIC